MADGLALSDAEFARVRRRIRDQAGIALSDAKRTLAVSRLGKLQRALGFADFGGYLDHLESSADPADHEAFVNALTTNLTRFWREEHHFEHLCTQLPRLMAARAGEVAGRARPRLRIWSAGCSSGQEAYSIALSLLDAMPEIANWDFRILATDVDTAVLERAKAGVYPPGELQGVSEAHAALLEQLPSGEVRVPAAARRLVVFKPLNLIGAWPMRGPFDAVFCRNVAIYFDRPTQVALFARLGAMLAPGGYLYLGHSENLGSDAAGFRLVGKTTYLKAPAAARSHAA